MPIFPIVTMWWWTHNLIRQNRFYILQRFTAEPYHLIMKFGLSLRQNFGHKIMLECIVYGISGQCIRVYVGGCALYAGDWPGHDHHQQQLPCVFDTVASTNSLSCSRPPLPHTQSLRIHVCTRSPFIIPYTSVCCVSIDFN